MEIRTVGELMKTMQEMLDKGECNRDTEIAVYNSFHNSYHEVTALLAHSSPKFIGLIIEVDGGIRFVDEPKVIGRNEQESVETFINKNEARNATVTGVNKGDYNQ